MKKVEDSEGRGEKKYACPPTPQFWKKPFDISRFDLFVDLQLLNIAANNVNNRLPDGKIHLKRCSTGEGLPLKQDPWSMIKDRSSGIIAHWSEESLRDGPVLIGQEKRKATIFSFDIFSFKTLAFSRAA